MASQSYAKSSKLHNLLLKSEPRREKEFGVPADVRNRVLGGIRYDRLEREEVFNKFVDKFLKLKSEDPANFSNYVVSLQKVSNKVTRKSNPNKSKKLNYRQRRELGLYTIGKKSLKYKDLIPLHKLWIDYMNKFINLEDFRENRLFRWTNSPEDPNFEQVSIKLYRADYHGCEMRVLKSSCPCYVGISGIVAMETKNCFRLLGTDNIVRNVPKASCVFTFKVQEFEFIFYGKNLQVKPAERSSRKLKTVYVSDLQL